MEKESFYRKYKETILNSRKKWLAEPENIERQKDSTRYRIQLYKNSYYKLKELTESKVIPENTMEELKQSTLNKCAELKNTKTNNS
tara:strand:- start:1433 stop:1690 length:258 start_codon:yes stop_codon:yes gene_type:complete